MCRGRAPGGRPDRGAGQPLGDRDAGRTSHPVPGVGASARRRLERPDGPRRVERGVHQAPAGLRRTLTWDQGKELAQHQQITATTGTDVFFCDAHSPWQRGSNENMNGLLRDYFPKGTDLGIHTPEDLARSPRGQRPAPQDARMEPSGAVVRERPRGSLTRRRRRPPEAVRLGPPGLRLTASGCSTLPCRPPVADARPDDIIEPFNRCDVDWNSHVDPGATASGDAHQPAEDRVSRRRVDADLLRGDLPGPIRAEPRRAEARARRLSANRQGAARPARSRPGSRQELRQRGDHDQRAARRGGRPRRPRSLGGRPDPRDRSLGDRHARRADHSLRDAAASAARQTPGRPEGQERAACERYGAEQVRDAIAAAIVTLPEQLRAP